MKYIVYGFGKIGQNLVRQLIAAGIDLSIIIDTTHGGEEYRGIRIVSPESLNFDRYVNDTVLIALQSHEANNEVIKLLNDNGIDRVYPYYMDETSINEICINEKPLCNKCITCAYVESCKRFIDQNISKLGSVRVIEQINFMITSACSLNCKKCAAFIPKLKESKINIKISLSELKTYVNEFVERGYYLHQVMLSGGEPTINNELLDMLRYLENNEYVGYVKILSNGTVSLSNELFDFLKMSQKSIFMLDDYGKNLNMNQRLILEDNIKNLKKNNVTIFMLIILMVCGLISVTLVIGVWRKVLLIITIAMQDIVWSYYLTVGLRCVEEVEWLCLWVILKGTKMNMLI